MTVSLETLEAARNFHRLGEFGQAEQHYNKVLETDPKHVVALHGLGWIAYQQGRYEQAIEWLRQAVSCQEKNAALHSNLGAAYRAKGRLAEAEACYLQALRLRPDFAEAYNNLANILQAQGRVQEAITRYQQAVLARPNYAEAHSNLGLALKALGRRQEAMTHFQEAVRLQPDSPTMHCNLGLLLSEAGQLPEAAAHLGEAIRLQPDHAPFHVNRGLVLLSQGRRHDAVTHFEQALSLQPSLPDVHNTLGYAFLRHGELDRALAHFDQARRLREAIESHQAADRPIDKPNQSLEGKETSASQTSHFESREAAPLHYQALELRKLKRLSEAEAQCREALRIHPEFAEAYVTLGLILQDQGRLQEAASAFHQALRLRPDHAGAFMYIGKALREEGHLERALAYLRHALTLKPDLAEAHMYLGLTLADRGALDDAAAAYREALCLHPDLVPALSHLGCLLDELGQPEEGRLLLERALNLGSDEHQVHFEFGALLVNQGHFAEARTHFIKSLELQPDYSPTYFALARDSKYPFSADELERIKTMLARADLPLRDRVNLHLALARVLDRARDFDAAFRHCEQGNAFKHELLKLQGTAFDSERHASFIDRLVDAFNPSFFRQVQAFGSDSDVPIFIVGMPRSGTSLVEQILASHPAVYGAGEIRAMRRLVADLPAELGSNLDYPECMVNLDQAASRRLASGYLEALRRLGAERLRVTDKVPMNFHQLGLIASLFPRCHIIHCCRDPRDVCWSCYFQNFREVHFAADLKTLGNYYRQYRRLMGHWQEVLPIPILEVCYEDLVETLEQVSRQIVSFCDLPWDERCLDFHQTERTVRTSSNIQVRQPIYKSSVGYWKNYERHLGPLLEILDQP